MTSDNMLRKSLRIILGGHENQRKDGITRHLYREFEAKDHTLNFTTVIGSKVKLQICCVQKDITVCIVVTERLYMCLWVEKQLQHNGTQVPEEPVVHRRTTDHQM